MNWDILLKSKTVWAMLAGLATAGGAYAHGDMTLPQAGAAAIAGLGGIFIRDTLASLQKLLAGITPKAVGASTPGAVSPTLPGELGVVADAITSGLTQAVSNYQSQLVGQLGQAIAEVLPKTPEVPK